MFHMNVVYAAVTLWGLKLMQGYKESVLAATGGFILTHVRLFLTSLCCMSLVGAKS